MLCPYRTTPHLLQMLHTTRAWVTKIRPSHSSLSQEVIAIPPVRTSTSYLVREVKSANTPINALTSPFTLAPPSPDASAIHGAPQGGVVLRLATLQSCELSLFLTRIPLVAAVSTAVSTVARSVKAHTSSCRAFCQPLPETMDSPSQRSQILGGGEVMAVRPSHDKLV